MYTTNSSVDIQLLKLSPLHTWAQITLNRLHNRKYPSLYTWKLVKHILKLVNIYTRKEIRGLDIMNCATKHLDDLS